MIFNKKHVLLAGAAFSLFAPNSAFAAEADQAPQAASYDASLEEIVVTARRREESIQTVPVAVTAFSASTLSEKGVKSSLDLQKLVPGIILNGAGSDANTTFFIRGQGKDVIGPGLPSVIGYINDVPTGGWAAALPTYDVANIQVLKGPQGTLFGRNTTGGAILLYTQKPTYEFEGYAEGTVSNYNGHGLQGAINVPISRDKIALRVAGTISKRDGFVENLGVGPDLDDENYHSYRVSLLVEPTDTISNTTVYEFFRSNAGGEAAIGFDTLNSAALAPLPITFYHALPDIFLPFAAAQQAAAGDAAGAAGTNFAAAFINAHFNCRVSVTCDIDQQIARQKADGPRKVYSDFAPSLYARTNTITNTTTIELGSVTLKNIFGYRLARVHIDSAVDGLGLGVLNAETDHSDRQISEEVQVSGNLFNDKLSYLFGGFYLDVKPDKQNSLDIRLFEVSAANVLPPFKAFLPNGFPGLSGVSNAYYGERSKALFGNLTYEVLEGLKLNAGYRYTWDQASLCAITYAPGAPTVFNSLDQCRAAPGAFNDVAKFKAPTWSAGLDYQATPDIFTYFVARRGYRAGSINAPKLSTTGPAGDPLSNYQSYRPQTITDFEVGIKAKWNVGDVRGRFNLAAFTGKMKDLQYNLGGIPTNLDGDNNPTNEPANTSLIINAGQAIIKGIEIDGLIVPTPNLTLTYGVSYLSAKVSGFTNPPAFQSLGIGTPVISNAPEWSYLLGASYKLPMEWAGTTFRINADYYHVSSRRVNLDMMSGYGVANASIEARNMGGAPISLSIFVNNLTDETYRRNSGLSGDQPGVLAGSYGAPRVAGARLRYDF